VYLTQEQHLDLASREFHPSTPEELAFLISTAVYAYIGPELPNFTALNQALGALEMVKQEFYRRTFATMNDANSCLNGDSVPAFAWPCRHTQYYEEAQERGAAAIAAVHELEKAPPRKTPRARTAARKNPAKKAAPARKSTKSTARKPTTRRTK
jgi:hypothetical protein